jgi:GLE1-like protein/CCCH-type zinc finger
VCPTAIPALPKPDKDATEDELMESLGMAKNKTGEFESFERFLQRTEGLVSMVADIMSSHPESHRLFGGHNSATTWLKRFMALLPPKPEQLPLNTAPVLDAFLTGAGHMLANLYADEFKEILNVITTDTITRLDVGSVGAPRAHRLKETIKGGFEGFRQNLPARALDSLYNDGGTVPPPAPVANSSNSTFGLLSPPSNPFLSKQTPFTASPFGQTSSDDAMAFSGQRSQSSIQFGGVGNQPNVDSGMMDSSTSSVGGNTFGGQPSQFNTAAPATSSVFVALPATNAFLGATPAASTPFGAPQAMQPPFGVTQSTSSPFGAPQTTQSPFGAAASTPFGSTQPGSTSFGLGQTVTPSPFGSTQSGTLPFGGSSITPPTPFGAPQQMNAAKGGTSNSTLFGAPQPAQTPFGVPPVALTPFGSTTSGPTPFSANQTPFGVPTNNPNPFGGASNATQSPFGGAAMSTSPFAGNAQQSTAFGGPFGSASTQANNFSGNAVQNPSAFSGQSQGSSFNSNFSAPIGTKKAPCKFFAQGSCRYGENCRFSHDAQSAGGGNTGGFGFSQTSDFGNSPFGGPRR